MSEKIIHNPDKSRFETEVGGHLCVLDYELEGSTVRMPHVGVPDAVGGRGIAGDLTCAALDWAREAGYSVRPDCPYVKAWIGKHPEYADLVP